MTNCD